MREKINNMEVLFVGGYYLDSLYDSLNNNSKTSLDYAAHNLQVAMLKGFELNNLNYSVVTAPHIGSYPFLYKEVYIRGYKSMDGKLASVSYINLPLIKKIIIERKCKNEILKWCNINSGERVIIFYNFDCIKVAKQIKEKDPTIKTCLFITDLPEFMAADKSFLTRINIFFSNYNEKKKKSYDFIDSFILIAKQMKNKLPINNKPWALLEGIFNQTQHIEEPIYNEIESTKSKTNTILYTGNLGKRYGILDLLEAFSKIDDENYKLQICGDGDGLPEVIDYQTKDPRLEYLGLLPRNSVIELQKQATVLINPRHSTDEYTKYSFPSKTIEYMASGTPVLMSKLESIPNEYLEHIFFFDDESPEGMKNKIIEICKMDRKYLWFFGQKARNFIFEKKTASPQMEKIIKFLNQK